MDEMEETYDRKKAARVVTMSRLAAMAVVFYLAAAGRAAAADEGVTVAVAGTDHIDVLTVRGGSVKRSRVAKVAATRDLVWDADGALWVLDHEDHLWRVAPGKEQGHAQQIPSPSDNYGREMGLVPGYQKDRIGLIFDDDLVYY